jgi:hypothetical protein
VAQRRSRDQATRERVDITCAHRHDEVPSAREIARDRLGIAETRQPVDRPTTQA